MTVMKMWQTHEAVVSDLFVFSVSVSVSVLCALDAARCLASGTL